MYKEVIERAERILLNDDDLTAEQFNVIQDLLSTLKYTIVSAAVTLGSAKSERKAAAVRKNGKRPPRPGSNPRGRPRKQTK
jgi:hypothetical protein